MANPVANKNERTTQEYQDRFTKAIRVFVDYSVKDSLAREPQVYADAILPALMPALKRAIVTFMSDLVASFQQVLERSLSVESLKWRLEALRTGKPLAEIALLHSLIYRVEQVLLINHQSGLLLDHLELREAQLADPDLISGMLTAITDFIRDSFQIQTITTSGTLQYGGKVIWTERGSKVTIAALIRGQPAPDFRDTLQNALNQIEAHLLPSIKESTERAQLEGYASKYLKPCLSSIYSAPKQASRFWRYIASGIVVLLFLIPIVLGTLTIRSKLLLARYESVFKNIPGVVITHSEKRNKHFYFYGFQDRYAQNPNIALLNAHLDPKDAILALQPFISEDPSILERRLLNTFSFPQSVGFKVRDGVLHLTGSVPFNWLQANHEKLVTIAGWIPFEMSDLKDTEYLKMMALKNKIEHQVFHFKSASAKLSPSETGQLDEFLDNLAEINKLADVTHRSWNLLIQGFADDKGSIEINRTISRKRATEIAHILEISGVPSRKIRISALGSTEHLDRTVYFQLTLLDSQKKGNHAS